MNGHAIIDSHYSTNLTTNVPDQRTLILRNNYNETDK